MSNVFKVFFACILLSQGSRHDDQLYETVIYPAAERELLPTPPKHLLVLQEVISRLINYKKRQHIGCDTNNHNL